MMSKPKILQLELEDAMIMAEDEQGNDLLRFGIRMKERKTQVEKNVLIQFPTLNQWDEYVNSCADLYLKMGQSFDSLYLPNDITELGDKEIFKQFAYLTSACLMVKLLREEVKRIFFDYLEPYIEGMDTEESQKWIMANASMNTVFYMFTAILHVDDFLKKKSRSLLEMTFQTVIESLWQKAYTKKPAGPSDELKEPATSRFATYS